MSNDLATFNPFDPATLQCPFPHYAQMRDEQPVMYIESMDMYLVTRHDLVLQVIRDVETYSSRFGRASLPLPPEAHDRMAAVVAEGWPRVPTMLTADMPDHTRYRRLISKAFTPKVIAELQPVIRRITTRLIDSWIDAGSIEFVEQFGVPLPVEVIAHALNVPDDRLADFKRWSDASVGAIGADLSDDEWVENHRLLLELAAFIQGQIDRKHPHHQSSLRRTVLTVSAERG